MNYRFLIAVAAVCSLTLNACGGGRVLPSNDVSGQAGSSDLEQASYRIGPGDTLEVFVWRNPEISTTVQVRPDGMISTPLVEDMLAVGKTPSELARDMEEVLAVYVKTPKVNIIVSGFQGIAGDMIRVVGQAQNPQAIPYREGMSVLDVMIAVGGLGQFAAGNKAKLIRKENGEEVEYRIRLSDLINKGDMKENVKMQPGDVIIIPESFF
jgi:polysaccharide biosynthesis/export protein